MYHSDVWDFKDSLKQKVLLCGETLSGARFRIVSISYKGGELTVTFNDGTFCNPEMLRSITGFQDVNEAQRFLLGETV